MVETVSDELQYDVINKMSNLAVEPSDLDQYFDMDNKLSQTTCSDSNEKSCNSNSQFNKSDVFELNSKRTHEIAAIEDYVNSTKEIEPFFVADLSSVASQFQKWRLKLPRFTPFYAVKSNNNPGVVKTLISLGASFDCASLAEIKAVLDFGVSPRKIIYANPCKSPNYIRYAAQNGINRMTFDNIDELYKIKENHPTAELVIRIHVDDSKSICAFGVKFGVRLGNTKALLEAALKLELNVIGVSFHVGSGCTDASAYADAIKRAKSVFDEAKEVGFNFNLLDIGGGFPGVGGSYVKLEFEEIADAVNEAYDEYFGGAKDIELMAEPGRYFNLNAFSLVTNITSRRTIETGDGKSFMYYVNDGVYGSFNCLIFDHAALSYPRILLNKAEGLTVHSTAEEMKAPLYDCSIWGPTCDSIDCLSKSIKMPELNVGDWLIFDNMGAYTLVASSGFNGMTNPKVFYLSSGPNDLIKPDYNTNFMQEQRAYLIGEDFVLS